MSEPLEGAEAFEPRPGTPRFAVEPSPTDSAGAERATIPPHPGFPPDAAVAATGAIDKPSSGEPDRLDGTGDPDDSDGPDELEVEVVGGADGDGTAGADAPRKRRRRGSRG